MVGTSLTTQGGVSTVARGMLESTLARRCEIRYFATHRDGSGPVKLGAAALGVLRVWWALVAARPMLMHVHLASRASFWRKLLVLLPAFALRVPVLVHLHGAEFQSFHAREVGAVGRLLIRTVFKHSKCVVALSNGWKDWLVSTFPGARVEVIHNAVPVPEERGAALHQEDTAPSVLFMGRLGKRKGAYDLVHAFANLSAQFPRARLVMAGDGDVTGVRSLAESLGVSDRIDTPGWVDATGAMRLRSEAAVYALPSYNEGLPMSVLEAMASGLPVVTCPVGGIPDAITDAAEGFLVEPGNIVALTRRLSELLDDPARARAMGEAGRQRVQRCFSVEATVDRWLALYSDLQPRHRIEQEAAA